MTDDVVNDAEMEDATTPSDFFDHEPSKQEKIDVSFKSSLSTEPICALGRGISIACSLQIPLGADSRTFQ